MLPFVVGGGGGGVFDRQENWREIHEKKLQTQLICWIAFALLGAIIGWTYEITFARSQKLLQKSLNQINMLSQQLFYKNVTKAIVEKTPSHEKPDKKESESKSNNNNNNDN
jgi:hypothetical protein